MKRFTILKYRNVLRKQFNGNKLSIEDLSILREGRRRETIKNYDKDYINLIRESRRTHLLNKYLLEPV